MFQSYEEDFCRILNSLQKKVHTASTQPNEIRQSAVSEGVKEIEEAERCLRQMEIELTVMPPSNKAALSLQCRRYKEDLEELKKLLRKEEIKFTDQKSRETLMGANLVNVIDMEGFTDQKQKLIAQNGFGSIAKLEEAKRAGYEAEGYAVQSMNELRIQRDKLDNAVQNNREIGDNLSQGTRILNGMIRKNVQNKLIMFGIAALLIVGIIVLVYIKLS